MTRYEHVTMCAEQPTGGSPLAVIPDAPELDTSTMQAIARRLGVTETVFVQKKPTPGNRYRVRVFTSEQESPHGGHSAVGTAATLVRLGVISPGRTVQECGTGRQELSATATGATLTGSGTPVREPVPRPDALLALVGLTPADATPLPVARAGYGSGFAFLPVRPEALPRARPDFAAMRKAQLPALCLVSWQPQRQHARLRLFAPGFGIDEDPACVPVALNLGVWLAGAGLLPTADGTHHYTVSQGEEVQRPATCLGTVTMTDGRPVQGTLTGRVTQVASGDVLPFHA